TNASVIDLYASGSSTYLPTTPITTSFVGFFSRPKKAFQLSNSGSLLVDSFSLARTVLSNCSFNMFSGTSYIVEASIDSTTALRFTLQNKASFFRISLLSLCSVRQTKTSGCTPYSNNVLTECCVGLVLSSPAAAK